MENNFDYDNFVSETYKKFQEYFLLQEWMILMLNIWKSWSS